MHVYIDMVCLLQRNSSSSDHHHRLRLRLMDSVFHLEDGDRAAFLDQISQAFGCVYICLKYYVPPPYNCLKGLDGIFHERRNEESLSRRLFQVYRDSSTYPDTGLIPGLAFSTKNPYMKLHLHDFEGLVSSDFQLQFYQEAGIKTIVLMGCATGEIELGFSDDPQVDLETELKTLIRIRFPHHTTADPNQPPSSSSSSLLSLSVDSPDLLFTTPPPPFLPQETLFENALPPPLSPPTTAAVTTAAAAHEQAIQMVSQFRSAHVPSIESEDAAMTRAILAVLSSPSTSSSSPHQNLRRNIPTAFRRYRAGSAPRLVPQKQSRFKRAVLFFRNLERTRPEFPVHGNRPTDTQLHHMISERRRRERLNESFHILRSFLPHGTKKDKASVLSSTTEYLSSLKSEVAELTKRNRILESQVMSSSRKPESGVEYLEGGVHPSTSSEEERVSVEMAEVSSSSSSSSSEGRLMEVRVRVRGEDRLVDLVSRVLGFLRGETRVSLTSVESNTRMVESVAVHVLVMRLRVQGDEFDESGFREAVRRVIVDESQKQPNN